jgi:hypothetical protein
MTQKRATRWVWAAVIFLAAIGIAAATRRMLVLLWPAQFGGKFPPAAAMDAGFARHFALTLVHIIPGAIFMVLAPLQFVPAIRAKHLSFHRWSGRLVFASGLVIGSSALVMSYTMNIGGSERNRGHHALRHCLSILPGQGLSAHPTERSSAPSRVDDPGVRRGAGSGHDATDRGNILRFSQADAARILRDCVLAGIHHYVSRR